MILNNKSFQPLESITKPNLTTSEAAHYLNRSQQTLRLWACLESGPVKPLRINGRLAWPLRDIRRVAGLPS